VDYTYSRKGGTMDFSGRVIFSDHMVYGYSLLHNFHVSGIFVDGSGRVLATKSLATDRGDFSPIPFHTSFAVPANAAGMSFRYKGTAISGAGEEGGGGTMDFWEDPAR
jgi:hypothetical protein